MMKYTRNNLKKIEEVFDELEYTIRYERGNFQSGYCIVDDKKVVVINKFYDVESRINCLIEILDQLEFDENQLSDNSQKVLSGLKKHLLSSDQTTKTS